MARILLTSALAVLVGLLPSAALAQAPPETSDGVVVRIDGDYAVPRNTSIERLVVINGDLTLAGRARTVVVVNGDAVVEGEVTDHITVVRGDLELRDGARVDDVLLIRSGLRQAQGATVTGEIERQGAWLWPGVAILLGAIFIIGSVIIAIVAAVLFAAFGGRQLGDAAAMMTARPGAAIGLGLGVAVLGPIVAALIAGTVVGIPLALALLLVALPLLGLLGAVVAATWIGLMILNRGGLAERGERPFGAALLGIAIMAAVMILPGIGFLAVVLISIWGTGALVLRAIRPHSAPPPSQRQPEELSVDLPPDPEVVEQY